MEAAAGFEPAHNGFAVRSLNHLGTPPCRGRTHTYTTRAGAVSARAASCVDRALISATPSPSPAGASSNSRRLAREVQTGC